ncbi:MAG: PIN domain-containing protein [Actinobacteria bacterium]|nr:PIN domain-containing protein [Actinomycetota bacterium]
MRVLLDTNLFLDVILERDEYYKDSSKIWSLISDKRLAGYISAISINNLYYILKRIIELKFVEKIIDQILDEFEIIPLTKEILKQARSIKNKDYEDSIQYFSAINSTCDFIITRDKNDFPHIGIRIISPSEFLATL